MTYKLETQRRMGRARATGLQRESGRRARHTRLRLVKRCGYIKGSALERSIERMKVLWNHNGSRWWRRGGGGVNTHTRTRSHACTHTHIHTHALQMCCEHQLDLTSSSKSSVNHETTKSSDRKNIETVLDQ